MKKKEKRSKTGPTKSLLTFTSPHPSPHSVLSFSLLPTLQFKSTCTSSPSSSRVFFHPSSPPVSSVTDTWHQPPPPVYIIPWLLPPVSPRPHPANSPPPSLPPQCSSPLPRGCPFVPLFIPSLPPSAFTPSSPLLCTQRRSGQTLLVYHTPAMTFYHSSSSTPSL